MKPISVSQLNAYIKRVLQTDPLLGDIAVVGEVSNFKAHTSGHAYFSLKDATSRLSCFLNADLYAAVRRTHGADYVSDGTLLTVSGHVRLYEPGGSYSLNVRDLEREARPGDLAAAFEALKAKLAAEGLFDPARKRPLPAFPRRVAVVTSGSGAALADILRIIEKRNRCVNILVCPVRVQGEGAAAEIAGAIETLNRRYPDTDCVIVGRGGGSAEDLWAFNEEIVARAIAASAIPVVSAVGHETDFTIADFAADFRAETPTAAAQRVVPSVAETRERLTARVSALRAGMRSRLAEASRRLDVCDDGRLAALFGCRTETESRRADAAIAALTGAVRTVSLALENRLGAAAARLEALDPKAVLGRGYAILTDGAGRPVTSAAETAPGARLTVTLADGELKTEVVERVLRTAR